MKRTTTASTDMPSSTSPSSSNEQKLSPRKRQQCYRWLLGMLAAYLILLVMGHTPVLVLGDDENDEKETTTNDDKATTVQVDVHGETTTTTNLEKEEETPENMWNWEPEEEEETHREVLWEEETHKDEEEEVMPETKITPKQEDMEPPMRETLEEGEETRIDPMEQQPVDATTHSETDSEPGEEEEEATTQRPDGTEEQSQIRDEPEESKKDTQQSSLCDCQPLIDSRTRAYRTESNYLRAQLANKQAELESMTAHWDELNASVETLERKLASFQDNGGNTQTTTTSRPLDCDDALKKSKVKVASLQSELSAAKDKIKQLSGVSFAKQFHKEVNDLWGQMTDALKSVLS